jgi:D-sedoheptulose 7-phosphate isomerase
MNRDKILQQLNESKRVLEKFIQNEDNIKAIEIAANLMINSIKNGGKIISCGNGGSMADAMHFAEELTGKYRENREPIAAVSISDVSHISCVSNDFGYSQVFSRYISALAKKGDILLAISTSGNSENVILAAQKAKEKGINVIALSGKDGGKLSAVCDVEIRVEHFGYADRIQEIHIKVIHILIMLIEEGLK